VYSPGPEDAGEVGGVGVCGFEKTPVAAEPIGGVAGIPEEPGPPNIRVKLPGACGAGFGGDTGAEFKFSGSELAGIGALKNLVNSPGDEWLAGSAGGGASGGAGRGGGSGLAGPGELKIRVNSPGSSRLAGAGGSGCGAGAC